MKVKVLFLATAACAFMLGSALPAAAGSHLSCYKVKDTIAKAKFTGITLSSNTGDTTNATGCTVSTGAKLCCDSVDKTGHSGPGPTNDANQFCCYKVKCAKGSGTGTLNLKDQFGTRALPVSKLAYLCAPSSPSAAFLDASADLY